MKKILVCVLMLIAGFHGNLLAQGKYITRDGKVTFYSKAPAEEIDGVNSKSAAILDSQNGQLALTLNMKAFEFEKALMQEHFNENYAESDKFPKAEFKGTIANNNEIKYTTDGVYPVKVTGKLTMHGVTKDVITDGTIEIKGDKLSAKSTFTLLLKDYNIEIPKLVKDKVSETVKVVVDLNMSPFKAPN